MGNYLEKLSTAKPTLLDRLLERTDLKTRAHAAYRTQRTVTSADIQAFNSKNLDDETLRQLRKAISFTMSSFEIPNGRNIMDVIENHVRILEFSGASIEIATIAYRSLILDNPQGSWIPNGQTVNQRILFLQNKLCSLVSNYIYGGSADSNPFLDPEIRFACIEIARGLLAEVDGSGAEAIKQQLSIECFDAIPPIVFPDEGPLTHDALRESINKRDEIVAHRKSELLRDCRERGVEPPEWLQ